MLAWLAPAPAYGEDPARPKVAIEAAWLFAAPEEGGEILVPGAPPDGALERLYTARFRHEGAKPADGLEITLAIPDGEHYIAGSATGPGAEIAYSVDGGQTFDAPAALALPVDDADGGARARRAGPADYSHIRWTLPGTHPPGRAGLVSFRARIIEAQTDVATDVETDLDTDVETQ
jgi:hypothetical protein